MRPFEWLIAAVVAVIEWQWAGGRRVPLTLTAIGLAAVVASQVAEGQRAVMWPGYATVAALLGGARAPRAPSGIVRRLARWILALVVVVLGVVLPWAWPVMKLPAPGGPFPIGTTWLVVRDSSRRERFGPTPHGIREFPVKVWYPAAPGASGPAGRYMTGGNAAGLPPLLTQQLQLVRTHAIDDAPIAEGRWPVVIFSHGYASPVEQNTPQMEALASRGYVVARLAHPGESSWAPFPDGHGVPFDTAVTGLLERRAAAAPATGRG